MSLAITSTELWHSPCLFLVRQGWPSLYLLNVFSFKGRNDKRFGQNGPREEKRREKYMLDHTFFIVCHWISTAFGDIWRTMRWISPFIRAETYKSVIFAAKAKEVWQEDNLLTREVRFFSFHSSIHQISTSSSHKGTCHAYKYLSPKSYDETYPLNRSWSKQDGFTRSSGWRTTFRSSRPT